MLSEKRWKIDAVIRLFLGLFGSICLGLIFLQLWFHGGGEEWNERRFWFFTVNTAVFHLVALVFVGLFLREERMSWVEAFGLNSSGMAGAFLLAALAAVVMLPLSWGLGEFSARFMRDVAEMEPVTQQSVQTLEQTKNWGQRAMFGLVAILMAPVVEELLFRGILYPTIKQAGFPRVALWGTALFFAFTHANVMTFLPLTVLAIVLTGLYERTNNLLAPIFTHSIFNAVNFFWLVSGA